MADIGDLLSITAPVIPAWLSLTDNGDGTALLSGTPAYDQLGDFDVELSVSDDSGATDAQPFTITVSENIVNVKILEAQKVSTRVPVICSGKLSAKSEAKLSFKIGGIIDRIFVSEGSSVSKGQLLARLNLSEIQAKVDQASLAMEKAQRDYDRVKSLYEDSVATLEQFQDVTTQLDLAIANLKISKFNFIFR